MGHITWQFIGIKLSCHGEIVCITVQAEVAFYMHDLLLSAI